MPSAPPEPADLIRVVVIDADDLVRQTVAALLGIGGRIEVVGIAGQTGPALDLVTLARPDVVVVDPRLPDLDAGLAFIKRLHATAPWVRVLIVCSPELLERVGQADGVDRCIRKTFRPDDLTAAIVAASQSTPA
ncbi:MAG TPA: response regulator [Candidatus Limnocylindrales bacterium]|nr:response regulator [Candidatus Limnocylindrales bacterium]